MENAAQHHLFDRICWAKDNLEPVQPQYAIVWEDPSILDAPCHVVIPAPEWLAMALHGDLLPPIEAYLHDKTTPDGAPKLHPYAEPIGSMTEEEAMEYLLMKDVPTHVWAEKRNRITFKIIPRKNVPTNRAYRDNWQLKQEAS